MAAWKISLIATRMPWPLTIGIGTPWCFLPLRGERLTRPQGTRVLVTVSGARVDGTIGFIILE